VGHVGTGLNNGKGKHNLSAKSGWTRVAVVVVVVDCCGEGRERGIFGSGVLP